MNKVIELLNLLDLISQMILIADILPPWNYFSHFTEFLINTRLQFTIKADHPSLPLLGTSKSFDKLLFHLWISNFANLFHPRFFDISGFSGGLNTFPLPR